MKSIVVNNKKEIIGRPSPVINASLLASVNKARKIMGLTTLTTLIPKASSEFEANDVARVIGKIEVKKVKVEKKAVEVKKVSKIGQECSKFATPLDYLHNCYKKKEIVAKNRQIVPMKRELVSQRIVTIAGFSAKLIRVGKVERPTPTQKKGFTTPKRPVQMKMVVRMEKGMTNLGYFLSLGVIKGERHYNTLSTMDINVHIDRIADFLSHGDAITKEGNKIDVVFCNDGIEIVGHAPKETVCVDGVNYRWSYECEFISTLALKLRDMGYQFSGKDGFRTISINPTDKWYDEIRKIITYLATKTTNIIVDAVYRAMNVVTGDVKVNLQMCSIANVKICTNETLINKITWTPCLYINGRLAIEHSTEFGDLSKLYTAANNANDLEFVDHGRLFIDGVEYESIELNELNNVTHYYNYFDSILLLKRDNIVFVAYEKGSKWCDDINVKKLIYASDFNYYESSLRLLAYNDKLADTDYYANYECIKILVECHFDDVYDVTEGTWNDWSIYENAQEIMNKANLTNEQMIEILKEFSFQRNNPLTSLLFVYLTSEMPEIDVIGEIFGAVNRQYIYENYGVCILNSIVSMGEVNGDEGWQEAFGIMMTIGDDNCNDDWDTDDDLPGWDDIDHSGGYDCSEAKMWSREYQRDNMYHGLVGTVISHCTTDANINAVDGEVCGSLWAKGATASFKDSGLIFAPVKKSISVIFNQDVWSKIMDGKDRTLSCCKYIRETDICINAKDAINKHYYNEVWVVPNKTKVVAGFYKECCEQYFINRIKDICHQLNVPCIELKDYRAYHTFYTSIGDGYDRAASNAYNRMVTEYNWKQLEQFSFKSEYHSYDHIKEEEKELYYIDQYEEEYFDLQMCASINIEIHTSNTIVASPMVHQCAWCKSLMIKGERVNDTVATKFDGNNSHGICKECKVAMMLEHFGSQDIMKFKVELPIIKEETKLDTSHVVCVDKTLPLMGRSCKQDMNLQLFADNNTGVTVPDTNGSEKEVRVVQKETSSRKEGVVMNHQLFNKCNNTTETE